MKQLLFLLLFPCLAMAQYPGNAGQKISLGEQTTADGLVYRGLAADTTRKPSVDTMAYILLDTNTNIIWQYKKAVNNAWTKINLTQSDTTSFNYVNTYGAQTVNGAKTLTSNLILKNSQEPSRATIVTTQGFAADTTNWTRGTGWTFNATQAVATAATGDLTYTPSLTITSGNAYEITYTVTSYTSGTLTVAFGNASLALPTHNATANVILLLPTSATGGFRFTTSTFTGNLDNVSVVEISNPAPILFAGQDDGSATLYSSLRMPNSSSIAFGGGERYTTGINNVANGISALIVNTTGAGNIANGTNSLLNNTTGNNNVSNGTNALRNNTTGSSNMANGLQSLFANTIGSNNVGVGVNSLASNTIGSNNIAIGTSALYNTLSFGILAGSSNIGIGSNAGDNIYGSAFGNVAIGNLIDFPDSIGSNQVVIKNIIFAKGASGTGTTIAGQVGIGTNAPTAGYILTVADSVYVGGRVSAAGYTTRSDYNLKDEIQSLNYGLNEVLQMQPVKYTYKSNGEQQLGFIAQDIGTLIPESVHFDEFMGVDYQSIIPILTKAIQEQNVLIKALEQRILILENK